MQLFPTVVAAPRGASSACDAPTSDTRSAADPSNGQAFRSALSAARQNGDGSASNTVERRSSRPDTPEPLDDDATASDTEPQADAAMSADELAALLLWLAPASTTPAPTTPAIALTATDGDALTETATAPIAATGTESAPTATIGSLAAQPTGPDLAPLTTADLLATDTTDTGAPPANPLTAFAQSQADATLAGAVPPTVAGIPVPTDILTDDAGTTQPLTAPTTPASTTTAPATPAASGPAASIASVTTDATGTASQPIDPSILGVIQNATSTATTPADANTTVADPAGSAPATTPTASVSSLAADVGARVVAMTTPTTTVRPTGTATAQTGSAALTDEAQVSADGSTAQAAGAVPASTLALPGQAVAASGASSEATAGTFAEALEAGPASTTRRSQGASSEINPAAIGAHSATGTGQAQAAGAVQTSAVAAPPIATQVADLALAASRRLGQSVQMVLQPEGLGTVSLRVSVERAGLGVHIAVDNPQAREMLQASWPQLQQSLDQRGLTVQSLLLDLSNGRSNSEGFQAFQQFTGQQSRGSSNGNRRGSATVAAIDEGPAPQPGAGSSSRVDYRI